MYHIPHVFELPAYIAQAVNTDSSSNNKKEGIIGIPRLDRHVVFTHRGDVHIIDLSVLPSLTEYFTQLSPLSNITIGNGPRQQQAGTLPINLASCLALAVPAPPFDAFAAVATDIAVRGLAEQCRVCSKLEDLEHGVKMRLCSKCKDEARSRRALYCSKGCQAVDWNARHKQEHAGTLQWDVRSALDRITA